MKALDFSKLFLKI